MSVTNFCTLFDSRYLSRGLALYNSLLEHCPGFHLYVLCMDSDAADTLNAANLGNLTVISLEQFENNDLLSIKGSRTRQEYCWTCTPAIIRYCLETFALRQCTYLDADIFFFDNPGILLAEMNEKSVFITPHNYHPDYDQSATSGIYCVQFVTFDNTDSARAVLETWYQNCISWCFARVEEGKFGDQKYLDTWPEDYPCVKVCQHQGGGVAAWNISRYDLIDNKGKVYIRDISKGKNYPLVFYHFHDFHFNEDGLWYHRSGPNGYWISQSAYHHIYKPYLRALYQIGKQLKFNAPTDLPRAPKFFTRQDFETTLLGRTEDESDRDFLRSAYQFSQDKYVVNMLDKTERARVFDLVLRANLNLSRETLWHFPENLGYMAMMVKQRKLDRLEQMWIFKIAKCIYLQIR